MNSEFLKNIEKESQGLFEGQPQWFTNEESTAVLLGLSEGELWLVVWTSRSATEIALQLQFVGDEGLWSKSLRGFPRLLHALVEIKEGYGASVLPDSWKSVPANEIAISLM